MTDIVVIEDDGLDDLGPAVNVAALLERTYPGYIWEVSGCRGGGIHIKCGQTAAFGNYGHMIHPREFFNWTNLAHEALKGAGELLERAGLPRGRWNGEVPTKLEGADPRHRRVLQ